MVPKFRCWFKDSGLQAAHMVEWDKLKEFVGLGRLFDDSKKSTLFNLMQSIGLKDKNGVEVFQGDIVRCTRGCPHEVVWLQEYAGMYVGGMPAWYLSGLSEGYAWTCEEEIIGNIYENPELLEEEK
ncbi:DNA-packaging protein [Enterococcus casseliflavus]|nr:DNA-packaging protein [Enterococcus casseliflavus]